MNDPHPWYTRVGFLIFVVVPATSLYFSRPEARAPNPTPVAIAASTKVKPPAPEPTGTGRKRMVITLNSASAPEQLYVAKEPPEEINWYAFAD